MIRSAPSSAQGRDQRHVAHEVGLGEVVELVLAQLSLRAQEAEVDRARAQAVEVLGEALLVVGPDGADVDRPAVAQDLFDGVVAEVGRHRWLPIASGLPSWMAGPAESILRPGNRAVLDVRWLQVIAGRESWHAGCYAERCPTSPPSATAWSTARSRGGAFAIPPCWRPCGRSLASAFCRPSWRSSPTRTAPLPIEQGQTISQPYIVALMTEALRLGPRTACSRSAPGPVTPQQSSARIAREVYTIERHAELAETATRRLAELGFDNVVVRHGDGTLGWPEHAPYDAIVVTAGGPQVPEPLLAQLAPADGSSSPSARRRPARARARHAPRRRQLRA